MQPKHKKSLRRFIFWLIRFGLLLALVYVLLKQFGYSEPALNWVFESLLPFAIISGVFTHPITLIIIALIVVFQVQNWHGEDE